MTYIKSVGGNRRAHQRFVDVIHNQAMSGEGLVEWTNLLTVFEDVILAGDSGIDAIRGCIGGGSRKIYDSGGKFKRNGVHPSILDFLPHIETGGAVAVIAAPGAVAHDIPDAGAGEVASGKFIVSIIEIGSAEVMAEFVANHPDSTHFAGAKHFRFDGISTHLDAIESKAINFGGVRPNIIAGAGHFLAVALVDYCQAVEHSVAVVVKFREVDIFVDVLQPFHNHGNGAVRAVVFGRAVEVNPRSHSHFNVQLAVTLFQIIIAERANIGPILLVHHILELFLGVFGCCIFVIE